MTKRCCPRCRHTGVDKGRGIDGRRCYRCQACGDTWSEGRHGRRRYSPQRPWFQFHDTGAARWVRPAGA